jgi:L-alanine-DL-glutamate epimerase-like enolase superfamily enzyme
MTSRQRSTSSPVDANGGYTTGQAVRVAHCAPTLHAHFGAATANLRHVEYFHDHQRIDRLLFDGALDAHGGVLTPDPGRPGLGVQLRVADAQQYRRS